MALVACLSGNRKNERYFDPMHSCQDMNEHINSSGPIYIRNIGLMSYVITISNKPVSYSAYSNFWAINSFI